MVVINKPISGIHNRTLLKVLVHFIIIRLAFYMNISEFVRLQYKNDLLVKKGAWSIKLGMAQYPHSFVASLTTCMPILVLLSQNAQLLCYATTLGVYY